MSENTAKIGFILLFVVVALIFLITGYISIYIGFIAPIQNGHYPLYQLANSFGITERTNFICFLIASIPFAIIFIGGFITDIRR